MTSANHSAASIHTHTAPAKANLAKRPTPPGASLSVIDRIGKALATFASVGLTPLSCAKSGDWKDMMRWEKALCHNRCDGKLIANTRIRS